MRGYKSIGSGTATGYFIYQEVKQMKTRENQMGDIGMGNGRLGA